MKKVLAVTILLMMKMMCIAQSITLLDSGTKASIRGLSIVDDNTIWASGSNGYFARSIDGGKTFTWKQIAGYEKREFRDIEAFDANIAVAIAIDIPAIIVKTTDGGNTWKEVFKDTTTGMFLDAMDFDDKGNGVIVGDPIKGQLFFAETNDYGNIWTSHFGVRVSDGEALFAASGSNIKLIDGSKYYVTGGTKSRLFLNNDAIDLNEIVQGKETTGANSIAVNKTNVIIVGGDFSNDTIAHNNCVLYDVKSKHFTVPETSPHGYRSCVIFINDQQLICCGTSGVDVSGDGGLNWKLITKTGFHVCAKAKKGSTVFLAGGNGRIAKLNQ